MSVANQVVSQLYTGTGQTHFAIPFAFLHGDAPAVCAVYLFDNTTGVRTKLQISTDYTLPVASVDSDPTEVVLVVPLPAGKTLELRREYPLTQPAQYINTGIFPAKTHEAALDRLTFGIQQIGARLKRALVLTSVDPTSPELPKGAAKQVLAVNDAGTGYIWKDASDVLTDAGNASGKLKAPTDGDYGGSAGNPSGVAVGDLYEDAFDRVATLLGKLVPSPPQALSLKVLQLIGSYSALRAGTGATDVCTSSSSPQITPGTTQTYASGFAEADSGILSAEIDGTAVGTIPLTTGSDVGINGKLEIVAEFDPYTGAGFGKEGIYKAIAARINATALAVGLHTAQLKHTLTGNTALLPFAVDDPGTPVPAIGTISTSGATQYLSGVPGLAVGALVLVPGSATGVVGTHYNPTHVLRGSSGVSDPVDYQPPTPPAANATVAQTIGLAVKSGQYSESVGVTLNGYNSRGDTAAANATSVVRVDTVGSEAARLQSGTGQYPSTGYGSAFSSALSLASSKELQFLNGRYQYPPAVNYSAKLPAGPDYSSLTPDSYANMRWATFSLGSVSAVSALTFAIGSALNFGGSAVVSGIVLQVRVDGASPTSGWVDANAAYPGVGSPSNNGDAALDVGNSTATSKRVTFGTVPKTGTAFVRIGIPSGSTKAFGGIS